MVAGVPVVAGGPVVVGRGGAAVDVGVDVVVVGIGGTVVGGAVMAVVEVGNGEVVAAAGDAEGRPAQPPAARASTTAIRHRRRVGDASTVCDTTGMRRRTVAGLGALALALSLTACSSGPTGTVRRAGSAAGAGTTVPAGDPEAAAASETVPARAPDALDPPAVRTPGGIVVPVLGREGGRWKVSTPCGRDAVVASATPIPATTVVLDPGHGGYDPGAVGPNGLSEATLNLAVSKYAAGALERAGFSTVLTRDGDYGMNLTNRARLAVGLQAKAFVSVHHNAAAWAPSPIPGTEAYHQVDSPESKRLAGLVYEEVVGALRPFAVHWVTSGAGVTWRTRANGEDWYAMVRQPKGVPAALEELAFLSNPPEASLLAEPDVQRVEGEAVARGVIRFLATRDPGSGYVDGGPMPPRPRPAPRGAGDEGCDDPPL